MTAYVFAPGSGTFHEVSQDVTRTAVWRQTCNDALISTRIASPRRTWVDRVEQLPPQMKPCWGCFHGRDPRPTEYTGPRTQAVRR